MGDISNISKKTRERAFVFMNNARKIGIPVGDSRFKPTQDYLSWWLANNNGYYLVVYATPQGYLAEMFEEHSDGEITETFLGITNVRVLLFALKKAGFQDAMKVLEKQGGLSFLDDIEDEDLKDFIDRMSD